MARIYELDMSGLNTKRLRYSLILSKESCFDYKNVQYGMNLSDVLMAHICFHQGNMSTNRSLHYLQKQTKEQCIIWNTILKPALKYKSKNN